MEKVNVDHIILGIDPGTIFMGYGLIGVKDRKLSVIEANLLNFRRIKSNYERLGLIYKEIDRIIETFGPQVVAIESQFYGKDIQAMLKLGRAQGVAIAASYNRGLAVFEYAPLQIKQAITGHGMASKEQVALMLKNMLKMDDAKIPLDASDALAVAVCHHVWSKSPVQKTDRVSWKEYIAKHPNKVH